MIIERKERRFAYFGWAMAAALNAAIAIGVSLPLGYGLLGVVIVFFGMEILHTAFQIRTIVSRYVLWRFFQRDRAEKLVLKVLNDLNFPRPDERLYDVQGYFEKVAEDKDIAADIRVAAAAFTSQLATLRLSGGVFWTMWVEAAWERALEKYADTFPLNASSA